MCYSFKNKNNFELIPKIEKFAFTKKKKKLKKTVRNFRLKIKT